MATPIPPDRSRVDRSRERPSAPSSRLRARTHHALVRAVMPVAGARYAHTNLIARDWRRLADFYVNVFGCAPVPPERDYRPDQIERATGVPGAALTGIHLRLPGGGASGPTLEIFSYSESVDAGPPVANRLGYGHIAFEVADVHDARAQVMGAGGGSIGEVLTVATATGARVTWCYVTDPEGNLIELQSWAPGLAPQDAGAQP